MGTIKSKISAFHWTNLANIHSIINSIIRSSVYPKTLFIPSHPTMVGSEQARALTTLTQLELRLGARGIYALTLNAARGR